MLSLFGISPDCKDNSPAERRRVLQERKRELAAAKGYRGSREKVPAMPADERPHTQPTQQTTRPAKKPHFRSFAMRF